MAYDEYEDSDDGTEQMFWVVGCEYEVSWGFPSLAYGGRQVEGGEEGLERLASCLINFPSIPFEPAED